MRNLLKVSDLNKSDINLILENTNLVKKNIGCPYHPLAKIANRKFMANLFFEPSTRTRLSFETAMKSLGGEVITIDNVNNSSFEKGESFSDTLRTVAQYADVMVLRTKHKIEENLTEIPTSIINAGDGDGGHPSQALIDFYTIRSKFGLKEDLNVLFLGDLKYSRTVHSLIKLLSNYNYKLYHRCPNNRKLPISLRKFSEDAEENWTERILPKMDIIYSVREQKERIDDNIFNYAIKYGLKAVNLNMIKDSAIIMSPLPREEEIPVWFDKDPRSVYFEQVKNGVYVRAAILMQILELDRLN